MGIVTPLATSQLFAARTFTLLDPPGAVGRWIVRRARGAEVDPRHIIVGADGHALGLVRKARRPPSQILYDARWEVVDPGGALLLVLLTTRTSLTARDDDRRLGVLRRKLVFVNRPPETPVKLYAGPAGSEVEVGALAPRRGYSRFNPPGESRIVDMSGATAAIVTGAGDFRHVAEIQEGIDDALRMLVIAFACSFADHKWLWWTPPSGGSGG